MTTDPSQAINAIRDLHCDAETAMQVLAALATRYVEWLDSINADPVTDKACTLLDQAGDQLAEMADWAKETRAGHAAEDFA